MIKVNRSENDSNSKVLKKFSLRARKSNVAKRVKATKFQTKKPSQLRKRRKALMRIRYQDMYELSKKTGKKLSNLLSGTKK